VVCNSDHLHQWGRALSSFTESSSSLNTGASYAQPEMASLDRGRRGEAVLGVGSFASRPFRTPGCCGAHPIGPTHAASCHWEQEIDFGRRVVAEIPKLRRYALQLTRDPAAVEDLVQESVVRGLSKRHLWHEGTDLRAWLCTILHHQHVNEIRRMVRQGPVVDLGDADERLVSPPAQDKVLEWHDVRHALARLTRGQQEALILIGLGGWSYERAAKASGVPVGTIRSRLARGRSRLRLAA
jgi:RNA polymerase sigma-70 factor, ECF subfamily